MKFYEWGVHHNDIVIGLADLVDGIGSDVNSGPNAHAGILKQLEQCAAAPTFIALLEQAWCEYQHAPERNTPTTTICASPGLSRRLTCLISAWQDSQSVAAFFDLNKQKQRSLMEWTPLGLSVGNACNMEYNSYGLKHTAEHPARIYLDDGAFNDAMVLSGFSPPWAGRLNYDYCNHPLSPAFRRLRSI